MTKLGLLKCLLELTFTCLVACLLPFSPAYTMRLIITWLIMQLFVGRFRGKALLVWDEIRMMLTAYAGTFIIACLFLPFPPFRWETFLYLILFLVVDFLFGLLVNQHTHHILWKNVCHKALIVGQGSVAAQLYNVCRTNRFSLMAVQGFIDLNDSDFVTVSQEPVELPKPVWKLSQLEEIIETNEIDTILFAAPEMGRKDMKKIVDRIADKVKIIKYLPHIEGPITFDSKIDDFDGLLMISTAKGTISPLQKAVKRATDIVGSICGMIIVLPLTAYVFVKNRRDGDTDPIFFVQERIGKDGHLFKMYKYRTMVPNAEQLLDELMEKDPAIRKEYTENKKLKEDPRITKAGKFLREKSLDEFPQFINVFLGHMSLVGPRPYLPREIEDMGDYYNDIIQIKPGVTGMWQTHGRSEVNFEDRLELDAYYYRNWNLWLDMTIFVKTIKGLFSKDQDAY
jgi:undecaprenyl-phosphate galactose phosphotransferase